MAQSLVGTGGSTAGSYTMDARLSAYLGGESVRFGRAGPIVSPACGCRQRRPFGGSEIVGASRVIGRLFNVDLSEVWYADATAAACTNLGEGVLAAAASGLATGSLLRRRSRWAACPRARSAALLRVDLCRLAQDPGPPEERERRFSLPWFFTALPLRASS